MLYLHPWEPREYSLFRLGQFMGSARHYDGWVIPQVGLNLCRNEKQSMTGEVAKGDFDEHIIAVCDALKRFGRPAFVRIGYEFNGRGCACS